jgi:FAD/FMN-containing dehydrogenase
MELIPELSQIVGASHVLTGADTERFSHDWMRVYSYTPMAVVRPGSTDEVSKVVKACVAADVAMVPISGNSGLTGGTVAEGAIMISMERMNRIREVSRDARVAIVDAGVILSNLHDAAEAEGLVFPLTFGARGTAMVGGALSTNAGGSNVVRYGSTRGLCLVLEVVLPSGEILNSMSELHKDNSGYNLKDLFIGAEGTLGLITGAVVRLFPKPQAYGTAMVAVPDLDAALDLLNRLQTATGGAVEAFEYMPRAYMEGFRATFPDRRTPFDCDYDIAVMVEVGATAPRDTVPLEDGTVPLVSFLEDTLATMFEEGLVIDAEVAQSDGQRAEMWARREAAAEVSLHQGPVVNNDVALPLDKIATFLDMAGARVRAIDPDADISGVGHLGDGNLHYTVRPTDMSAQMKHDIMEAVEDVVLELQGSFSAEHGIGISKKPQMARRKDPVAVATMRAIKAALDPKDLMNPGKVLPD